MDTTAGTTTTEASRKVRLSRAQAQILVAVSTVIVLALGVMAMFNGGSRPAVSDIGYEAAGPVADEGVDPERLLAEIENARSTTTVAGQTGGVGESADPSTSLTYGGVPSEDAMGRTTVLRTSRETADSEEFSGIDETDVAGEPLRGSGVRPGGRQRPVTDSVTGPDDFGTFDETEVVDPTGDRASGPAGTATVDGNRPPQLPVRTIEMRIPVGRKVTLFSDSTLASGWSDPDNSADWLCLTFTPERRDFWLDGADCEGRGLWAQVPVAGVYVVHVGVKEATTEFPDGTGTQSSEGVTLRLIAG